MNEYGETVCARCGEAVGTRFCPSCGLKIESAPEMPARPAWEVRDVTPKVDYGPLEEVPSAHGVAAAVPAVEAPPLPDWWEVRDAAPEVAQGSLEDVGLDQASGHESNGVGDDLPDEAFVDPMPEVTFASAEPLAEPTVESPSVDPVPARDDAQPGLRHHVSPPVAEPWTDHRPRSRRVAVLCLAVLILVLLVPARRLRR